MTFVNHLKPHSSVLNGPRFGVSELSGYTGLRSLLGTHGSVLMTGSLGTWFPRTYDRPGIFVWVFTVSEVEAGGRTYGTRSVGVTFRRRRLSDPVRPRSLRRPSDLRPGPRTLLVSILDGRIGTPGCVICRGLRVEVGSPGRLYFNAPQSGSETPGA